MNKRSRERGRGVDREGRVRGGGGGGRGGGGGGGRGGGRRGGGGGGVGRGGKQTSLGVKGLKKQSSNFMREKVRFPSVVGTISFRELRTNLTEGCRMI